LPKPAGLIKDKITNTDSLFWQEICLIFPRRQTGKFLLQGAGNENKPGTDKSTPQPGAKPAKDSKEPGGLCPSIGPGSRKSEQG
jgi:hypothetical protein